MKMNNMILKTGGKLIGKVFEEGLYAVGMSVMREGQNNATDTVVREMKRGADHVGKKYNLIKYD